MNFEEPLTGYLVVRFQDVHFQQDLFTSVKVVVLLAQALLFLYQIQDPDECNHIR